VFHTEGRREEGGWLSIVINYRRLWTIPMFSLNQTSHQCQNASKHYPFSASVAVPPFLKHRQLPNKGNFTAPSPKDTITTPVPNKEIWPELWP
jgi:hypothetical protein